MVGAAMVLVLAGAAAGGGVAGRMGMGPAMMGMGPGMMGMHRAGMAGCPMMGTATAGTAEITLERAKEIAQEYADVHLKGFTVEKVLPITGRMHIMYSVELKGPNEEVRVLHVNPFGEVMPFGGPWRRGA
jgi:hypothetical protein